MKIDQLLARRPLAVALSTVLAASFTPYVYAQTAQDDEDTQEQAEEQGQAEEAMLDRVQVTGSLVRRLEYESISPVQIISADTSVELGQIEAADVLQQSSVAAGSTQITNQFSGFVVEGGTGVQTLSLRGLGAARTLVLMDGRRPGPAGTRGQVGAFDLNVIPSTIVQRYEILKDGASSTYGSDAVAGVVNIITRTSVDRPVLTADIRAPFKSGGEAWTASGATGWNFDNGSVVAAFEVYEERPLHIGDRDFFECSEDLFFDQAGNRIDREDRSITRGTNLSGCSNLYANTVIDALTGVRYIPSPDGSTVGLIPGYRPRGNRSYAQAPQAFYEDVLNFDFYGDQQVIDNQERQTFFGKSDLTIGNDIRWDTTVLVNKRETSSARFRQFFPIVGGATSPIAAFRYAGSPGFVAQVPSGIAQPVMPFRSNQNIEVDYRYIATGLEGAFGGDKYWVWNLDASYSRSDGDYSSLGIVASRSGDVRFDRNAPVLNYFSPRYLSGQGIDELEAQIGQWDTGNTVYDQSVVSAVFSGDLFELPAGIAGAAVGAEHRRFSIDDQPGALSRAGDLWGQSSAQVTKGDDHVTELFGEVEVPLLAGLPAIESFTVNASARGFQYDSVDDADEVWKAGFAWQVIPSLRIRGTKGTSYRAPGLFELFLGDQTAFVSQLAIDPCIQWGESTNQFIRANCAAEGIPQNYAGGASSATVISSGGQGFLSPETSSAQTVGLVFTPTFADVSVSIDYFEFEVRDQISQLGSGSILGGCYGSPVFPNAFCNLFTRNPANDPTAPFAITNVRSTYLNVDKQLVRGYDMLFRYEKEFGFGNFELEGQVTYTMEDVSQLFDSAQASGFDRIDRNGDIGRPKLVGNLRAALQRQDWTYTWFMNYVDETRALELNPVTSYFGRPDSVRDIVADERLYHGASVRYAQNDWDIVVGVNNVFDADPPVVSSGVASRYGNVPAFATQYDWLGRRAFFRFSYRF
ncbi:TonB-dependent receptor plug domain-containing protein [Pseudomarimonas salicorniae]|uniref:TonB-dependent receptor n=1 Tax=Pseudomarimonas salicorniae TaxID=2933270 RepID=A0ABT0GK05_9GAMM|nr:TonB-dependent receptor [Lysobacter sp. CAU 1642]MCK7594877.1 TonB-dependent receptor [Lysobacter sp. CAU 1642]